MPPVLLCQSIEPTTVGEATRLMSFSYLSCALLQTKYWSYFVCALTIISNPTLFFYSVSRLPRLGSNPWESVND